MEYLLWISFIVVNYLTTSSARGEQNSGALSNSAIEADMAEMFPDDESIEGYDSLFQKILENGETIYYRADPKFPIFHRPSNDAERKYVILKHDEAHLNPTDNKTKIILRQQEADPKAYTVHMAVISPSKDILWDAVVVEQRKQDEDIITDLRKTYTEAQNILPGATCAWMGNIILCSGATDSPPVDRVDHPPVFRDIQFDTGRRRRPQDTEDNSVDLEQVTSEADIKQAPKSEKSEADSVKISSNLKKREVTYTNTLNSPDQELANENAESSSSKIETEDAAPNIVDNSTLISASASKSVISEAVTNSTNLETERSKPNNAAAAVQKPKAGNSTSVISGSSSADTNVDPKLKPVSSVSSAVGTAVPKTAAQTEAVTSPLGRSRSEVDNEIKHSILNPYIALTPHEKLLLKRNRPYDRDNGRYNPFDSESDDYMDVDDHFNERFHRNAPKHDDYDALTPFPSPAHKLKPFGRRARIGQAPRIRPDFQSAFQNPQLPYQKSFNSFPQPPYANAAQPASQNLYQSDLETVPQASYQDSLRPPSQRLPQNSFNSPYPSRTDFDVNPQLPYQHNFKPSSQHSPLNDLKPSSLYQPDIESIPQFSYHENLKVPYQQLYQNQNPAKRSTQASKKNVLGRTSQFPYGRAPRPSLFRTTAQPSVLHAMSEFRRRMKLSTPPASPLSPAYKYKTNYAPGLNVSPGGYNGPPTPIFPRTRTSPGSGDYSNFAAQSKYKNRRYEKQYLTKDDYSY